MLRLCSCIVDESNQDVANQKFFIARRVVCILCTAAYLVCSFARLYDIGKLWVWSMDFICQAKHRNAKIPVTVGIVLSLAILAVFKYAYIVDTSIILPVGLSFFTFQALSYSIDIYRGKIVEEKIC